MWYGQPPEVQFTCGIGVAPLKMFSSNQWLLLMHRVAEAKSGTVNTVVTVACPTPPSPVIDTLASLAALAAQFMHTGIDSISCVWPHFLCAALMSRRRTTRLRLAFDSSSQIE